MHEDPTKQLTCYVSFDPAIDIVAMGYTEPDGGDYARHFGTPRSYGSRDPRLVKVRPGQRATTFTIRALTNNEHAQCDAMPTAETRWLHALGLALVSAELCPAMTRETVATAVLPPAHGQSFGHDSLEYVKERVGYNTLLEIGAVAYNRGKLGPFALAYAPLLPTSAHGLTVVLQFLADIQEAEVSRTQAIAAASTSPPSSQPDPVTSAPPGDATATAASPDPSE